MHAMRHTICSWLIFVIASAAHADEPLTLKLWPEGAPEPAGFQAKPENELPRKNDQEVKRITDVSEPTLTVYRPQAANGTACLVFPGGGYRILAIEHEGTQVCQWLNTLGVTAVLVKYRVPARDKDNPSREPLQDAQRALGLVRHHASEWGVRPDRVGVLGFSAGANLVGHASWTRGERTYKQQPEQDDPRGPDFVVFVYGGGFLDKADRTKFRAGFGVPADAPPAFFVTAHDDGVTGEEAAQLYLAYRAHKLPAELHVFAKGGHGFGMRPAGNPINQWHVRCAEWLQSTGLVPPAGQAAAPGKPAAGAIGYWSGTLHAGSLKLRLAFDVARKEQALAGTLISVDQGNVKIALSSVAEDDRSVLFAVSSIDGEFRGTLNDRGDELSGTWSQGATKLPLVLTRSQRALEPRRPQEPRPPYPYRTEEVTIPTPTKDVTLAGTLTLPPALGPHPAVVLVSGSGPQDRDEALMGHRPFLVLADYLTRHGVAVLRYDDRGVGQSTGTFASGTTVDFAEDARAAVAWLRTRPEIDAGRLGIVGHSEGGTVAPLVAAADRQVAFIVLLAGVGVPMPKLLVRQTEDIARAMGKSDEQIARATKPLREILALLEAHADEGTLNQRVDELVEEAWQAMTPDERKQAGELDLPKLRARTRAFLSPQMRALAMLDPVPALRRVRCPVLALNGEKDLQVACRENLEGIAAALSAGGNRRVKTVALPGLNHLFQTCQSGAPSEYGEIEETLSPAALTLVSDWIDEVLAARR